MIGYPSGQVWRYLARSGLRTVPGKKIVLFLNTTRRSKIVSRAVARHATTSDDHLQCAVIPKIACVICAVLFIDVPHRNIIKLH